MIIKNLKPNLPGMVEKYMGPQIEQTMGIEFNTISLQKEIIRLCFAAIKIYTSIFS